MSHDSGSRRPATPDELRAQVEGTRERLGETVEELAAKADVRARAQDKIEGMRAQVKGKAAHAKAQVHESRVRALHLVHDKTVEPVRETAAHAKAHPAVPLLVLGGLALAALLVNIMTRRRMRRQNVLLAYGNAARDRVRRSGKGKGRPPWSQAAGRRRR